MQSRVCVISETRPTARSVFGLVSRVSRVSSRDCRLSVRFPAVSSTFHSPRREIPSFIHSHTRVIVWGAPETHSLERREEKLKDWMFIKGIVQPKKSFCHRLLKPHVISNLYEFHSSMKQKHKRRNFEECYDNRTGEQGWSNSKSACIHIYIE